MLRKNLSMEMLEKLEGLRKDYVNGVLNLVNYEVSLSEVEYPIGSVVSMDDLEENEYVIILSTFNDDSFSGMLVNIEELKDWEKVEYELGIFDFTNIADVEHQTIESFIEFIKEEKEELEEEENDEDDEEEEDDETESEVENNSLPKNNNDDVMLKILASLTDSNAKISQALGNIERKLDRL
jgi:hypothetical protein